MIILLIIFLIILSVILLLILHFILPPSQEWIYSDRKGTYVKVICSYKTNVTICYIAIDQFGKIIFTTTMQDISLFDFKMKFFKWRKLNEYE